MMFYICEPVDFAKSLESTFSVRAQRYLSHWLAEKQVENKDELIPNQDRLEIPNLNASPRPCKVSDI